MAYNFHLNQIFEENLEIDFTFSSQTFTIDAQQLVLTHTQPIRCLNTLTEFVYVASGVDADNFFSFEYRWSFNNTDWSAWHELLSDFGNFFENTALDVWLQIRITSTIDTGSLEIKEINIAGTRTLLEIFQPVTIETNKPVVYTNQDTYKVFSLSDYKIYLNSGHVENLSIKLRYTQTQGRTWSIWYDLNTETLLKIKPEKIKFCNFQFSFLNTGVEPISLFDLELIGEFQNVTADNKKMNKLGLKTQCNPLLTTTGPCDSTKIPKADCCTPCSESLTPWNEDIDSCECKNYTNINNKAIWAEHLKTINKLNNFKSETNSWKVSYALTDPDGNGIDHVLHEQTLHNIIQLKDIQIIVPGNQFPVDNLQFSGLDLDLIQSFEVRITKDEFKSKFGVEFRPSKKDILYLCDFNQLWEVEQMFPKRGFMNAEFYYRVLLKKYNDRKSRNYQDSDGAKNLIDALTKNTTLDGLFGIDVDNQIKKQTKDVTVNQKNTSQQISDKSLMTVRSALHAKASVIDVTLWNASLIVAKNSYSLPLNSEGLKLVEYTNTDRSLTIADNRAINFWFNTADYDVSWEYTLLSNYDYDNELGYKLTLFDSAFRFTINNTTHTCVVPGLVKDTWYCILVNLDQTNKVLEIAIYTRQSEDGKSLNNSDLVLVNKNIITITPDEFTHTSNIFIGGVNRFLNTGNSKTWNITNVRIYTEPISKADRTTILNENVTSLADQMIISDNAEIDLGLSKYGNL